ncbi:uncharacterized protein [Amphiura filiformis]|uniref:uncharacterized protein n=1 Tax=Amphiura filiformis TaxID=82378 RepID=UPI003B222C26
MASELSLDGGRVRLENIFRHMQRGLLYPSPYACFVTYWRRKDDPHGVKITKNDLSHLMKDLRIEIHKKYGKAHTTAVVGVNFSLWTKWCEEEGKEPPVGMTFKYEETLIDKIPKYKTSTVFSRASSFVDSKGDLWFHIKSDNRAHVSFVRQYIHKYLTEKLDIVCSDYVHQDVDTRSTKPDGSDGKVLGRRFSENLNNPSDPINLGNHTIIGYEDITNIGGSFALAQRLNINWAQIHAKSEQGIEDMIGRKTDDTIIPRQDEHTHIKSARARNENGDTTLVLRLGLPYGLSTYVDDRNHPIGPQSDEKGLYFAGFTKDVKVLETIMDQMIGGTEDYMQDRLFHDLRADLGGFFYIPSCKNLRLPLNEWSGDWIRYPGIDWQRMSRHFKKHSPNGVMFYNHKDYLFTMATAKKEDREKLNPPSYRILTLLANTFALWQDSWYFNRKQEEIGHLKAYVAAEYGPEKANEVMALSVMERKGWATKMTLRLSSSTKYGFRGQREINGKAINGANTFHIQPTEIIVGSMPNLGLGQGRYVMKYLTEEESMEGYLRNLSEASGVGHVVPGHERALKLGISGLIGHVQRKLDRTDDDESKRSFYRSVILSLEGVVDYCHNYAQLADQLASKLKACQVATRKNLLEIKERMNKLAEGKPETMTDALQLLFTMHVCLSLNGEPCGIGRVDQIIYPFYEADLAAGRITEASAQEVMEAFWIKLGEKVQQNRMMIEDHQPMGNLAMGGASGPYPQGASNNQWVQQITVGGTAADGTLAYNTLTKLALRASRLPLNAPCLSLRVRKDMPVEYLEEAAKVLKTGGAHPIFLNDDKLIPALFASGNNVGGDVANSSKWKSDVTLESARNYACDGCYEPQFPGENWFTLGGFSALNPLECALNMGKLYVTAGPTYLMGQTNSFTSRDIKGIKCFDDLVGLYKEHFRWLITKAISGQIGLYGTSSSICPAPLLSVLMDDCIERGRDFYDGGTKYNIFGPCFFAIPSAINSLYAIKHMVFDPKTAVITLPELVHCLRCDWGYKMVEPLFSSLVGGFRLELTAERYKRMREVALSLPRFGRGHSEVDDLGQELLKMIAEETVKVFTDPIKPIKDNMARFREKFGSCDSPFGFQIQPGVGNFESFVDFGYQNGASADGRRAGGSISSDLSPAPTPDDREPKQAPVQNSPGFCKVLKGYKGDGVNRFSNGAATDFNIDENYPEADLVDALKAFVSGEGSNVMTVTCASSDTLDEARKNPEAYDLLRLRMGGWSEFYTAMFPHNQEQHRRRPYNVPDQETL